MPSIAPFIVDGKVYAIPYANDFRIGYYNTVQYSNANITNAPTTWDEVYSNSKILKESGIVRYPLSLPLSATEPTTTTLIWLSLAKYGKVFNDDGSLDKEAVLGTLEFINNAVKEGLVDPANITSSGMDTYRKITSGDASFIVGPTSFVSRVNNTNESKVVGQVMPTRLPGSTNVSQYTFALPEGLGILKLSENKQSAMKFIEWFNSEETQEALNLVQNTIPTKTKVLEKIIADGTLKNTGALLEQSVTIKSPFPNGVPVYYTQMSDSIYNAINKMVLGQITPEQAYDAIDKTVNELNAQNN